jgi:hypothetical protein
VFLAEAGVVEYLGDLVACLGQVLQHGKPESKKSALNAIASVAGAAESAFIPYIPELLPVLQQFMTITQVLPSPCSPHVQRFLLKIIPSGVKG